MVAASPTRSVEIGIGQLIGRGTGKSIGIGNTWMTEGYEVDSSPATMYYYQSLPLALQLPILNANWYWKKYW